MINFKEHDGMLFEMLEEPVPLTNDAKMPVLVRLIQDDSPMGRHNKFAFSPLMKNNNPIIIDSIKENAASIAFNHMVFHYSNFEIIGTFVKEGSDKWALHQMMKGKWVVHEKAYPCHIHANMITWSNTETPPMFTMQTPETWLSENFLHSGWQIYAEPKPESENVIHGDIPADMRPEYFHLCKFKVGDWVECNGDQHLIESISRDLGRGNYYHFAHGNGGAYAKSIRRKLSPSEVIVKIGCLEGTVKDLSYVEDGRFWFIGKKTERCPGGMHAILYEEMLDAPTRSLVESLLKAQEEE